jgi:LysM repeat protein
VCGQGQIKRDVYVVNYCETLTGISQRLGLTLEQLLSANPEIKDPNLIFPGQRLIIP